jgi:hypothetical protein
MNASWVLAFVVAPALAVAFGFALVFIHDRSLRKNRQAPGE